MEVREEGPDTQAAARGDHDPASCDATLRELARRLTTAEDRVRRTVAEGLHDDLGQVLAAVRLHLHEARHAGDEVDRKAALEDADRLVTRAVTASRRMTFDLLTPSLPEARLGAELRRMAKRLHEEAGIPCTVAVDATARTTSDGAIALLRAAREALYNVAAHANATEASIGVAVDGDALRVEIADDGIGMAGPPPPPSAAGGFGLLIASERLRDVGGDLELTSAPGEGTRLVLWAPLADGGPR